MPFIDVPLDDFDTSELVEELKYRASRGIPPDMWMIALEILSAEGITATLLDPIREAMRHPLANQELLTEWESAVEAQAESETPDA